MFHYSCYNGNSIGVHKPPQNLRRQYCGVKPVPHWRSTNYRPQNIKFSPWATQCPGHKQLGNILLLTRSCYRLPGSCGRTTEERHHGSMSIWFRNSTQKSTRSDTLLPNWQKESWYTFEETSGYVLPERVNKWPNSMTDMMMIWFGNFFIMDELNVHMDTRVYKGL